MKKQLYSVALLSLLTSLSAFGMSSFDNFTTKYFSHAVALTSGLCVLHYGLAALDAHKDTGEWTFETMDGTPTRNSLGQKNYQKTPPNPFAKRFYLGRAALGLSPVLVIGLVELLRTCWSRK